MRVVGVDPGLGRCGYAVVDQGTGRPEAVTYESAEVTMVPSLSVPLDRDTAVKVLRLVDALEELDDVQDVYANFDIPDAVIAEVTS